MLEFIVVAFIVWALLEDRKNKNRSKRTKETHRQHPHHTNGRTNRNEKYTNENFSDFFPELKTQTSKTNELKVNRIIRLAGVTFEGRQKLIAETNTNENIRLKREPYNPHDKNAINVYDSKNRSLGWIPRGIARELAPLMDKRVTFKAEIIQKTGGSYPRGLEIRVYSL
ncbi:HIRAN domain-containing protein [Exiguobacterium sp. SH3S1]|uniref:HIRAN domain-containing protein n=1 Tax=Exiguobacterium sp. SH3S1 TaxID=2510955 RepID=UPI00103AB901|nr:HIRAN domain-containing protein [Exiguobacterium sp. SH3S1]TCI60327.1 hypothetical protein EVJ26_11160 [Exiguobacterium sp. SH3S1]